MRPVTGDSKTRRKVALHVGLLSLNVLVLTLFFSWRSAVTYYHGLILRWDFAAFQELLASPWRSAPWQALEQHVRTPAGQDRLIGEYLTALQETNSMVRTSLEELRSNVYDEWVLLWCYEGAFWRETWMDLPNWSFRGGGGSSRLDSEGLSMKLEALQRLLGSSRPERVSHPNWPGLAFTVFPRAKDPPGVDYSFTRRSSWQGCWMLVVTRCGTPFPQEIEVSPGTYQIIDR